MLYDRNEERRRRALRERQEASARLKEKLDGLRRKERAARTQLLGSTTRHANWHAHRLAYQDREAGYDGEMAEARYWVRSLMPDRYREALAPYVNAMPDASIIAVEVAAVRAHLDDWTRRGKELLHKQARVAYEAECVSYETWVQTHPEAQDWRAAPASRAQWMLIRRTVDRLDGIPMPALLKRGEAHDWLQRHGANLRLRGEAAAPASHAEAEPEAPKEAGQDRTREPEV